MQPVGRLQSQSGRCLDFLSVRQLWPAPCPCPNPMWESRDYWLLKGLSVPVHLVSTRFICLVSKVWLCKDFSGYTKTRQNQTQGDTCRSHVLSLLIVTDNQSGLGCFFLHAIHILCSVLMFPSEVTLLCFVVGGEAKTLSSVSPASNRAYSL